MDGGCKRKFGGASAAIEKKSRNVRIVMDPGGKSLIATYTNDVEGHGGVVFDAGPARFLGASAEKYDNGRYVQNIAEWLEQTNGVAPGKRILIFAPGMGDAIPEGMIAGLEQRGFAVTRVGREVPAVTDRLLEGYTQLWMFTGGPGASPPVADDQPSTISRFTAAGKGLLIVRTAVTCPPRTGSRRRTEMGQHAFGVQRATLVAPPLFPSVFQLPLSLT